MAFELEQRLNETTTTLRSSVHASRYLGNQCWAQGVFVERKNKILSRVAILRTELIDAFDRFEKNPRVQPIRVVQIRRSCFLHPYVEHKAIQPLDLVQQSVGHPSDSAIPPKHSVR